MHDTDGELAVDERRPDARVGEPEPVFGVEDVVHVLAERAELVEDVAAPEAGGLRDAPGREHPPVPGQGGHLRAPDLRHLAVAVDEARRADGPAGA